MWSGKNSCKSFLEAGLCLVKKSWVLAVASGDMVASKRVKKKVKRVVIAFHCFTPFKDADVGVGELR